MAFIALPSSAISSDGYEAVVVDLGYSASKPSCGIAATSVPACGKTFGQALSLVSELLVASTKPLLVLEAPLSVRHSSDGSPAIRGDFEKGRGWYHGAGAVTALAALRFLAVIAEKVGPKEILLSEAFFSNKEGATRHADDAVLILSRFWEVPVATLDKGCTPLLPSISGVPPVRVFRPNS